MSIASALLRRSPVYDLAVRLQRAGVTTVNIGLTENDIPVGSLFRRGLQAVIKIDGIDHAVAQDTYPTLLTREQIMRGVELIPLRYSVLYKAVTAAGFLEGRGISVPFINGVPKDKVIAELEGRAGHGKERR